MDFLEDHDLQGNTGKCQADDHRIPDHDYRGADRPLVCVPVLLGRSVHPWGSGQGQRTGSHLVRGVCQRERYVGRIQVCSSHSIRDLERPSGLASVPGRSIARPWRAGALLLDLGA